MRRHALASKKSKLPIKWSADGYDPETDKDHECRCVDVIFLGAVMEEKRPCTRCGTNCLVHAATDGNYYCERCKDDLVGAGVAEMA